MTLRWHPFLLRPDTPEAGVPLEQMLPPAYLAQAKARLQEATTALGMPYAPPALVPNTLLAHEAAAHAESHGYGDAFHQTALKAYFAGGRNLGDRETLVEIGEATGLDPVALRRDLEQRSFTREVSESLVRARELGITAVPTFVFPDGRALAGAQPWSVFAKAMELQGVSPRS